MIIAISIKDCKFFLEYDKDKYPDAPGDCDHSRGPGTCNPKKCPINMMERIRTEWRRLSQIKSRRSRSRRYRKMGTTFYVICTRHLEKMWVGKLQFLDEWTEKVVKAENPMLIRTPTPLQDLRRDIIQFRKRHSTDECSVVLVNDHSNDFLEPEFVYYRDVEYGGPLPTQEELKQWIVEKRDTMIREESSMPDIPSEFISPME